MGEGGRSRGKGVGEGGERSCNIQFAPICLRFVFVLSLFTHPHTLSPLPHVHPNHTYPPLFPHVYPNTHIHTCAHTQLTSVSKSMFNIRSASSMTRYRSDRRLNPLVFSRWSTSRPGVAKMEWRPSQFGNETPHGME